MRLVSLAPSGTEIVFSLGCGEWLVGRTAFCDFPEEAKRVAALGGWTTANVDAVATLKPDLVLTSTFLQVPIAAALEKQGVTFCHTDPRTLADVLGSFEMIATALGVPDRGSELRTRVEAELHSLQATSYQLQARVYAEEWPDPPMAAGNWVPDLILRAGEEPFLHPGERSRVVTLDEVRAFDPHVILLNYCGMAVMPADQQRAKFLARPGWRELRAAHAGRIAVLDDSLLNRPGPRLVEGLRQLQQTLTTARVAA